MNRPQKKVSDDTLSHTPKYKPNHHYQTVSDAYLINLIRLNKGDNEALNFLFVRHYKWAFGICSKFFKGKEEYKQEIKNAINNRFLKLQSDLIKETKEIGNLCAFIYPGLIQRCIDETRSKYIKTKSKTSFVDIDDPVLNGKTQNNGNDVNATRELLVSFINRLENPQQIKVLTMYLDEYKYAEIANEVGITVDNVRSNIQNGKRNLKNLIPVTRA